MSPGQVIVIGGGVIGTACAYYLSRGGWTVTIIDQAKFGTGCSHGNCGFVCPSHVLPLAVPGAVRLALSSLLKPDAPFRVKPRLSPALWSWFYHFARRCNQRDLLEAGHAIAALLNSARSLYDELIREEALACEWQTKGLLFVLQTQAGMDHFARADRWLRETFGVASARHDGAALATLEPALKPGLAGGWLYPGDAHLRPERLLSAWRRVLEVRGVTVLEDRAFQGFVCARARARAALTEAGELAADAFVVATGAWTPLLAEHLGCRVPIQPGKGYSLTMARPAQCPRQPLVFEEHRVAATPMQTGYRLGSTMEFAGYDATLNRRRLDYLKRAAAHYLHEPYGDPVEEEWFGWRPMTYDSKPIIDRSPKLHNVYIAAGHNMLGVSMAPATGKLVAQLLGGETPVVDPSPYSVRRF